MEYNKDHQIPLLLGVHLRDVTFQNVSLIICDVLTCCHYTEKSLKDFGINITLNTSSSVIHDRTSSNGHHDGNHGDNRVHLGKSPRQDISDIESDGQSPSQLDGSTSSNCHVEVDDVSNYCLIIILCLQCYIQLCLYGYLMFAQNCTRRALSVCNN